MGLSIVLRITTLLGITMGCRSELGKGTVMTMTLPEGQPIAATVDRVQHTFDNHKLEGLRVVLIEDSIEVADALCTWLKACRAEVRHFISSEHALTDPTSLDADFYLADFRQPGNMHGIDFLNEIRKRRGQPIRGALLTGETSSEFMTMATASGWPILFKPLQPDLLSKALAETHSR